MSEQGTSASKTTEPLAWETLCDQLKALGPRLLARLPERVRQNEAMVQESQRLLLYGLARTLSDAIVGDPSHPMFVPEISLAMNIFQPNSDTIYKSAIVEGNGVYRIKGERGSSRIFILAQIGPDPLRTGKLSHSLGQHDFDALKLDADGRFDVILSQKRPDGYEGDWWALDPGAERLMVRIVGCRWGEEREPRFGIDRLDVAPSRGRVVGTDVLYRMSEIPTITAICAMAFTDHVEKLREEGYINKLKVFDVSQMVGLTNQHYYEGAYELADDEALIVAAKVPDKVQYWSIILTNDIYETTDWANNQASLNDAQARVDSDGVFRAVVAARDPGVPNWLDTSGYPTGAIQGRWFETSSAPIPEVQKVKIDAVRALLPADTPIVTPQEREAVIRNRRIKAQMRTIW